VMHSLPPAERLSVLSGHTASTLAGGPIGVLSRGSSAATVAGGSDDDPMASQQLDRDLCTPRPVAQGMT
jgi:hypothetical protein